MAGKALILTGPSGVGKTTVALQLQRTLTNPWLFYEVDRAQPRPPNRPDFMTVDNDRRLRRANLLAARGYLDSGFSTIIEIGLTDEGDRKALDEAMSGIDTTVITLSCDAATLERHLAERDGTADAWAREHHAQLSGALPGAVEITTDGRDPATVASAIATLLTAA